MARVLTDQQEAFCVAYVMNGGNASEAATTAGYSHPGTMGPRQLMSEKVGHRLRQLAALNLTSRLGELVEALYSIAMDPLTPPRERIMALNSLVDRAGLSAPKGQAGAVNVQVNVATSGADAQKVIAEIWANSASRSKALAMATDATLPPHIEGIASQPIEYAEERERVS